MPKERFELSRALCPLRPERSASAYSATSAYNIILPKPKGLSIIFRRVVLPEDNPLLSQTKIPSAQGFLGYNFKTMDLKELTEQIQALVAAKGWDQPASSKPQMPRNLAISLVLEASEVLELFQWQDKAYDQAALAGELADTMLYLLQLASVSGIDLEQAVLSKIAQNHQRQWPEHQSGKAPL